MIIFTENDGPSVVASNYWQSDKAARGFYHISHNGGCVRLLVPEVCQGHVAEIRTAKEVVITRGIYSGGYYPRLYGTESTEFIFDDRTVDPFIIYTSLMQWEHPPDPLKDSGCIARFAAYQSRQGAPEMFFSAACRIRFAPLPSMD